MTVSNDLALEIIDRAASVKNFDVTVTRRVIRVMAPHEETMAAELLRRMSRIGPGGPGMRLSDMRRVQDLIDDLRGMRAAAWRDAGTLLRQELMEHAVATSQHMQEAYRRTVGIAGRSLAGPARADLRRFAFSRPFQGRTLTQWLANLRAADLRRMSRIIRLGYFEGQNPTTIVQRIFGSPSQRFLDGAVRSTRRSLRSVTRTALTHFAASAHEATAAANPRQIIGLMWVSKLDSGTTDICRFRDGRVTPLGENRLPARLRRLDEPGARPPAHVGCRSVVVPLLSPEGVVGGGRSVRMDDGSTVRFDSPAARARWSVRHVGRVPTEAT